MGEEGSAIRVGRNILVVEHFGTHGRLGSFGNLSWLVCGGAPRRRRGRGEGGWGLGSFCENAGRIVRFCCAVLRRAALGEGGCTTGRTEGTEGQRM